METKFTPGPWRYEKTIKEGCVTHAHVWGASVSISTSQSNEKALADMNLIAAAPELYKVLEEFRESFYGTSEVILDMDEIDKILAKARGE